MRRLLVLLTALALCLSLAACGDSGSSEGSDGPAAPWNVLTEEALSGDVTAWQGDDGSQLLLDVSISSYTFRTWYGRVGMGSLFRDGSGLGLKYCEIGADYFYYLVQEGGGFTVCHVGGGEGGSYGEINGLHFEPAQGEAAPYDLSLLDGVWQNALGETFVFDTGRMQVIDCFTDGTMSAGPLYESTDGRGPFVTGPEILYPCLSADGNAFVLFSDGNLPREADAESTGVFYRNGDMALYAKPEQASFEEADGRLWYDDGVNRFALPNGYALREDGMAWDEYGRPFAPEWPAEPYDPAAVWGENWIEESWVSKEITGGDDWARDGRGNEVSNEVPILMGGALPFTGMQNLISENHEDGTYCYEDITEDGQITVVSTAEQSCFVPDVQELGDYLAACALFLSDADTYERLSAEENEEYSKNISYPVYIVTYTAGENEDSRNWTVFATDTDTRTYLYAFCETPQAAEGMDEIYHSIFAQLHWSGAE